MDDLNRHISVIIFADIVGYSLLMHEDERLALSKLTRFEDVITQQAKAHGGEVVKAYGDGCLMIFPSALNAIRCSINIQKSLRKVPEVPLRIGIHIGEIVRKGNDIFGDGVNIAARIESMGVANSVLISSDIYVQIKNQQEIITKFLGEFTFKNIERDLNLYAVTNEGLSMPTIKDMKGKGEIKETGSSTIRRKSKYALITVLTILLIFILYKSSNFILNTTNQESRTDTEISLAVLPLLNLNQKDENLEYFSDGVTQDIIDELAKVRKFSVEAFSTSYQYKNSSLSYKDIANQMDADFIISGSSRIFGDSVKLSIELFDPHSKGRIWNGSYTRQMDNAPSIQLDIARQVAGSLNIKLTPDEETSLEKGGTDNGEAFNLFLQAKSEFQSLTQKGLISSISKLKRAIELDPLYSQAYTYLAWVYMFQSAPWFGGKRSFPEYDSIITPFLEKSIELDPESSDIYLVRGNSNLYAKGLLLEAKKDVEYAINLNSWPKVPTSYCICTIVSTYLANGDLRKAKEMANLGRKIDPFNAFIWWDRANIHIVEGEMQKAQVLYEEALENLNIPIFKFFVGWSYFHDGKYTNALQYLEKAYAENPFNFVVAYLSNAHYKLGNASEANRFRDELIQRISSGEHNLNLAMAMVSAVQSNVDETINWLEKAQRKYEYTFGYMVNIDPVFKPLYAEPGFIEIRKRMQYSY
jgi:class 3 adenylate cyclase/TolB-like protein/Tfp pilus assembly protein PilF